MTTRRRRALAGFAALAAAVALVAILVPGDGGPPPNPPTPEAGAEPAGDDGAAPVAPPSGEESEQGWTVGGRTVRWPGGEPVPGAEVRVLDGPGRYPFREVLRTRSGEDGRFLARIPARLTGVVLMARAGERLRSRPADVDRPVGDAAERDLSLLPAVATSGRVELPSGDPAADATVEVWSNILLEEGGNPQRATLRTDAFGRFRTPPVLGPTTWVARKPGYAPSELRVGTLNPDREPDEVRLRLRSGSTLRGRTIDGAGAPVAGARVRVYLTDGSSLDGRSGPAGEFEIADVPRPDVFSVAATHPDFPRAGGERIGEEPDYLTITLFRERPGVSGRIVDAWDRPVAGALLRLEGAGPSTTTAATGGFGFADLRPGDHRLVSPTGLVRPVGFSVRDGGGPVDLGTLVAADARCIHAIPVPADPLPDDVEIRVEVVLADGAVVPCKAPPDHFPISVAAFPVTLRATWDGRPAGEPVRVVAPPPGPCRRVEVPVDPGDVRRLAGRVVDARDGRPVTHFSVYYRIVSAHESVSAGRGFESEDGTFAISLPPGRIETLAVSAEGYATREIPPEAVDGTAVVELARE